MPTKHRLEQLRQPRAVAFQACKKRKSDTSSVPNDVEDEKLSTTDKIDIENKCGVWFWNESANESTEEGEEGDENDRNKSDLGVERLGQREQLVQKFQEGR